MGVRCLLLKVRVLRCDGMLQLTGDVLRQAMQEDRSQGLIPFWVGGPWGVWVKAMKAMKAMKVSCVLCVSSHAV